VWIALVFDHETKVECLAQPASQSLSHHQVSFVLLCGELGPVLAFHQDHMPLREQQQVGFGAKHAAHIAGIFVQLGIVDARLEELIVPAGPPAGCRVSDFAPWRCPPYLLDAKILGETKEPVVVSDELVFELRIGPALVVIGGKGVAQRETEVKDVGGVSFFGRAGTSQTLKEPDPAPGPVEERDKEADLEAALCAIDLSGEARNWPEGLGGDGLGFEQPAVLGWHVFQRWTVASADAIRAGRIARRVKTAVLTTVQLPEVVVDVASI
jgi:hypothetical protein